MTSHSGHILSSEALKRVLAAALTVTVGVEFFILYYTTPLVGDDAMYTCIIGASTHDGGASIQGSLSEVWRGWMFDGRLSNCLAAIMLLVPRAISAFVFSCLLMCTVLLSLRYLSPGRSGLSGVVWMLFATTFFVGWQDRLFLIDLSCNYLVPLALMLAYCWLFFTHRHGWLMMTLSVIVAVLSGIMQQISFGPLLCASVLIIAVRGRQTTARQWIMTACLLVGILPMLHPKMLGRVEDRLPFLITTFIRNIIGFSLLFIWTGLTAFRAWKNRADGSLRSVILSPTGFFIVAFWVTFVISLIWGTGGRMSMGATIFSAAGLASYLRRLGARLKKWTVCVMAVLTLSHLAYSDLMSIRLIKEFRSILIAWNNPQVQQVFYHAPEENQYLLLRKTISFPDIHLSGDYYQPLYSNLPDSYHRKVMIPDVLRRVEGSEITPIDGTAGIGRYKGYLLSLQPLADTTCRISYGPFSQNCDLISFPFTTDDEKQMYLIDLISPSSLTIFFDIYKIDSI